MFANLISARRLASQLVATLVAASLPGCGIERFFVDREVDRLCKIDGGIHIFEHPELPNEYQNADGTINIRALADARPGRSYFLLNEATYLKSDDPVIVRFSESLIRGADHKVVGVVIKYIRPMDHGTFPVTDGKSCPSEVSGSLMVSQVFRSKLRNS